MLTVGQKFYLPYHHTIGVVNWTGEENGLYKSEVCIKTIETYNVWCDKEGNVPHTNLKIVEEIKFEENQNVAIVNGNDRNSFTIAKIIAPEVTGKKGYVYKVKLQNGEETTVRPENVVDLFSVLDVLLPLANENLSEFTLILKKQEKIKN